MAALRRGAPFTQCQAVAGGVNQRSDDNQSKDRELADRDAIVQRSHNRQAGKEREMLCQSGEK